MASTPLIVIATDIRKAMCLQCDHRHEFTIAGSDDDVFLCKIGFRSSCSMKSALRNPDARCPHPNIEWAARWNLAKMEVSGGCLQDMPPGTPEEQRAQAERNAAAKERSKVITSRQTKRGAEQAVFKVYQ